MLKKWLAKIASKYWRYAQIRETILWQNELSDLTHETMKNVIQPEALQSLI